MWAVLGFQKHLQLTETKLNLPSNVDSSAVINAGKQRKGQQERKNDPPLNVF
jgi:hypothetical protein